MTAGIYVRISQDRDGTSASPDRQIEACEKYCDDNGLKIVDVYADRDTSAYGTRKRPEYQRLIDDLEAGRISVIVVWKLDRLTRRVSAIGEVLRIIESTGGSLASVNDQIDTTHAMGKAMLAILAGLAEGESESTSKRVRASVADSIARGDMPKGGSRCFGYSLEGELIPEEARRVRWMAKRFLDGTNFRQIAKRLNELGVSTTKGNQWTSKSVSQLLRSPRIGGYRLGTDRTTLVKGAWKPILNAPTFEALRVSLDKSRRPSQRANEPAHLLTGIASCGKCGEKLAHRVWKMKHAGDKPFQRLSCVQDVGRRSCGGVTVSEDALNALVRHEVAEHVVALQSSSPGAGERRRTEKRLKADEKALSDLVNERFVRRGIDDAAFDRARDVLTRRINEAQLALTQSGANAQRAQLSAMRLGEVQEWWESQPLTAARALIRSVISEVVVNPAARRGGNEFDPSRIEIRWHSPQA